MRREVITTADGSSTIFLPELNECYHSTHGAINEAMHIFIDAGFRVMMNQKSKLHILEIGFGTGLNALLSLIESIKENKEVFYHGIEPFPVDKCELDQINYPELIAHPLSNALFEKLHTSVWEKPQAITPTFELLKVKQRIEDIHLSTDFFDLVYFDAFAPTVQPELWQKEIFQKIFLSMTNGGILVTYSCKGDVKRALKACGFNLEKLPGPIGKREFLRATKNSTQNIE
ncbi:MAG: tRNA (5-methylaminomethyl-2-thiouridine)(34)-methyltransferase MnmD [Bacillota bacterium]